MNGKLAALLCSLVVTTLLGSSVVVKADEPLEVRMIPPVGEGAEQQWPQWRGPTRQGLVEDEGYRHRWDASLEDAAWKVEVPGEGHSSPIVWEDRIFLTTSHDYGEEVAIVCFRRSDGELLWETQVPSEDEPEHRHDVNTAASSTPITDGERVYAYFGNRGLVAMDFDGEVVWHQSLGRIAPHHGHGGSPVLYGDKIIMFQDHRGPAGSFVAAWDRETGEQVWRTSRTEQVGWGSPIVVQAGDRDELIVSSQQAVYGYDPGSGGELWKAEGMEIEVVPTPVAGEGLVIASSASWRPDKATLAIWPGGSGSVSETHIAWSEERHSPFLASPLLHDGLFYMIDDQEALLSCYDASTGELLYREDFAEDITTSHAHVDIPVAMVGVGDRIFITADDGRTWVFRAGREYELLHVNELPDSVFASPALVDGHWYWRTTDYLLSIAPEED